MIRCRAMRALWVGLCACLLLGQGECQSTTIALLEPAPESLDVRLTVLDYDGSPEDGKLAVLMKFTSGTKPVQLQGAVAVSCNGHALLFDKGWQSYVARVPLQPVGGSYQFTYVLKGVPHGVSVTVPARPVITSPKSGPPYQGAMVVIQKSLEIRYQPGGGTAVDVGAGDGKTGLGSPGPKPDNGVYGGFDVSRLQPGAGAIDVIRRYEYPLSATAFKSTLVNYSSTGDRLVRWLLPIDQMLARCPTAAEVASIDKKLTQTFEADPTAGTLVCTAAAGSADLTRLQERSYQALLAMQRIQFDAPLPWTSNSLYTWFAGAVRGIRFRSDIPNSFCCDPPGTINIQIPPDEPYTFAALATNKWIEAPDFTVGLRDLVVLFAHEARHNEGKSHNCPNSNDQTLAEMGAWGVQYYLLKWMADHSDPRFLAPPGSDPQFYRVATNAAAQGVLESSFCSPP